MERRTFLLASALAAQAAGAANPRIERSRDEGIAALKPSERELAHGMELHANSVVMDAYGFSPRCSLDVERYTREFEAGASKAELDDLREEMTMTGCITNEADRTEYLQAWRASGVTCIFQNAGEEGQDPMRLIKRLARFTYVTDMLRDHVVKAVQPDDIVSAKKQGKHALYFTGNGVPLTQAWNSVPDELRYVRIFFQLGIRMMHMTYNRRNMIGDGCAEPSNAGLSDFGRSVVAEMNRVGIIADVAHSGWRTSLETAKVSKMPMVASHSGAVAINRHIRCKPDEVIRAIADTGGYVGVCCIPSFLGRGGDINAFLDHIDHIAKRFGTDHVAIGTDVAYSPAGQQIPSRPSRTRYEYFWPPDAFSSHPRRHQSLDWTNWPLFTVGLVKRGYSDSDIQKIIGGNVLRVARAVLPQPIKT